MKIASWKVRGLNMAPTQKGMSSLVKEHNFDIINLMETKLDESKLRNISRFTF